MNGRRILIITNRVPYPLNDGGNLSTHAMIEGYHKAGWQVYVLAMNTSRHQVADAQLAKLYPGITGFTTVVVNNDVTVMGTLTNFLFSRQPSHAVRFFQASFANKLQEILRSFHPEVVQLESIFLATYLPYVRIGSKAIVTIRLHNIEYQVWERLARETKNSFKRYYLKDLAQRISRFEAQAWQDADMLLPITYTDASVVKNAGIKTELVVAPFGIDTAQVNDTATEEQWAGYHIGAMDWLPNVEAMNWFLKDIWPAVHTEVPPFHFYFAGRHMPESFKRLQIENVSCMGEVPDAGAFIADKKILIVPLRSGGGIRVKILEAMAAGKVIISTQVGMQGIDAIGGTHYRLADTKDEFVAAIKWCLAHKADAQQMAMNARKLALQAYNQDVIMQKVVNAVDRRING